MGPGAENAIARIPLPLRAPVDLGVEMSDSLQANEITLQFAAMRVVTRGPGPTPRSVFFSFQFFNCLPTRTERMMLDNEGDIDEVRREKQ
jgi:hypothetical protein